MFRVQMYDAFQKYTNIVKALSAILKTICSPQLGLSVSDYDDSVLVAGQNAWTVRAWKARVPSAIEMSSAGINIDMQHENGELRPTIGKAMRCVFHWKSRARTATCILSTQHLTSAGDSVSGVRERNHEEGKNGKLPETGRGKLTFVFFQRPFSPISI